MSTMALLEKVERSENEEPVPNWFMQTQFMIRILVNGLTANSIIMLLVSDTTSVSYSSAFKFLLAVDVAVLVLGFMSVLYVPMYVEQYKKQVTRKHWYYLFLHDLIVMTVLIFACGAASSIGYVGVYGQPETFWNKICNNDGDFCAYLGISVAFSYASFLCFFALTVLSSYVLMKPSLTKEQEPEFV